METAQVYDCVIYKVCPLGEKQTSQHGPEGE